MSEEANVMLAPSIIKVTINIGVGEGGQRLQLAERVLEVLTGMKPMRTLATQTNRDLGTRRGSPIGCKVTIRGEEEIKKFLKDAFWVRQNTLPSYNFDSSGNLSFGISDYTDFPGQKYDPDIGIFGMDVNVVLERPGHRVSRRRQQSSRVSASHRVGPEESRAWFSKIYNLKIVGDGEEEEDEDDEIDVPVDELPDNIKQAVEAAVPGGDITEAELEMEDGQQVYEVTVEKDGQEFEVEVSKDGEVLEVELEEEEE